MNGALGKFGQRKMQKQTEIGSPDEINIMTHNGYKAIGIIDGQYIYEKKGINEARKPYYCPIIPTLVNAEARIIMYKHYKKIPQEDLLYTDTDSIIYKGEYINKYEIGEDIGQFKIENKGEIHIKGRKGYRIGQTVKLAGITKKEQTIENFNKGKIENKRIETIHTAKTEKEIGTMTIEIKDIEEQTVKYEKERKQIVTQKIIKDIKEEDINYFLKDIENVLQ